MDWFYSLMIVFVVSRCTASEIFYVLSDDSTNITCSSQNNCGTLSQYLLDNDTLPVMDNVEYHFLPGEYYIYANIEMRNVSNVSLTGSDQLTPAEFVCLSRAFVAILYSYNVTVRNLAFNCGGNFGQLPIIDKSSLDSISIDTTVASLVFLSCLNCAVKDIVFLKYGFAGINIFGHSYLDDININTSTTVTIVDPCDPKIILLFTNEDNYYHDKNLITMNKLYLTGHSRICSKHVLVFMVLVQQKYHVLITIHNSHFYDIDQAILYMSTVYPGNNLLIKNCTFSNINSSLLHPDQMMYIYIPAFNTTVSFVNCKFHSNKYHRELINVYIYDIDIDGLCSNPANVSISNCSFVNNDCIMNLLYFQSFSKARCFTNIFISGITQFLNNLVYILDSIIYTTKMAVYLKGNLTLSNNVAVKSIMHFEFGSVTFSDIVTFVSNRCTQLIKVRSALMYIKVMEYSLIKFISNVYRYHAISIEAIFNDKIIFPFCFFQYITTTNSSNLLILPEHFVIEFVDNEIEEHFTVDSKFDITFHDLLSHCKWLPTAAFYGTNPGEINQQIIKIDGTNWTHHNRICYCFQNGTSDCNIDVLGQVYPGQTLQVDLCIPETKRYYIIYAETHSAALPNSACKVARQSEYINKIGNYSKRINFTISSESRKACELFLTIHPYVKTSTAFYVKLLSCPIGFTLQNGMCSCDPLLPSIIKTCYIQHSVIKRPANTWITFRTTQVNQTEYLMSDCPLDYCLPYSSDVNLLDPDLQCQFNRTGVLCSQCQRHLSMVFGSSRCMECTNVHILITLVVLVAGIILVVLLYLLNLTVTIGTINGIIFYANVIGINDSVFLVNNDVFKPLRVFISFANLDLGIEMCYYNGMDSYAKMWLQLFFPFYLSLIAISIIVASRYSSKLLKLTFARSLPVLATLFLLSYTGILRVVLTVLFSYSTITHYPSKHQQIVWSIDASIPLLGVKFAFLFIACLALLLLLLLPFNITLLFTRYLSRFKIINHFKPFLDAFQGSYKDAYYYWVGVHIIFRSLFFALNMFNLKMRLVATTIILVFFTSCYGYIRPYKNRLVSWYC